MGKSLDSLKRLAKGGRAMGHPSCPGGLLRLDGASQVANVTLADARTIMVQPFEKKLAHTVEKTIRDSDLGLNPSPPAIPSACRCP